MKWIKEDIHCVKHIKHRITDKQRTRKLRMRRKEWKLGKFPSLPHNPSQINAWDNATLSKDIYLSLSSSVMKKGGHFILYSAPSIAFFWGYFNSKSRDSRKSTATDLDDIENRKDKVRRVKKVNNFWNNWSLNTIIRPSGYEFPFSPILWRTRVIDVEEFTYLIIDYL